MWLDLCALYKNIAPFPASLKPLNPRLSLILRTVACGTLQVSVQPLGIQVMGKANTWTYQRTWLQVLYNPILMVFIKPQPGSSLLLINEGLFFIKNGSDLTLSLHPFASKVRIKPFHLFLVRMLLFFFYPFFMSYTYSSVPIEFKILLAPRFWYLNYINVFYRL